MTNQEKLNLLLERCANLMTERIQNDVPETGRFKPYYYIFDIPGTKNEGYLSVEFWETKGPEQRGLRFGALRQNTDMLIANYVKVGTNAELIKYLSAPETQTDWRTRILHLSDSVDDRW